MREENFMLSRRFSRRWCVSMSTQRIENDDYDGGGGGGAVVGIMFSCCRGST